MDLQQEFLIPDLKYFIWDVKRKLVSFHWKQYQAFHDAGDSPHPHYHPRKSRKMRLGGRWKAHRKVKLHGLRSPTQNTK